MGTAHGAEELGLCPHGLACQADAWGVKYFEKPITLSHDKGIFDPKAWDAVDADCGIARVNRATRARALLAHTYGPNF